MVSKTYTAVFTALTDMTFHIFCPCFKKNKKKKQDYKTKQNIKQLCILVWLAAHWDLRLEELTYRNNQHAKTHHHLPEENTLEHKHSLIITARRYSNQNLFPRNKLTSQRSCASDVFHKQLSIGVLKPCHAHTTIVRDTHLSDIALS